MVYALSHLQIWKSVIKWKFVLEINFWLLEMKDSTKKEDAAKMYEIISETRIEVDEQEA